MKCVVYALWCESEQVAHYACASREFLEAWLPRYASGELGACGPHRIVRCEGDA